MTERPADGHISPEGTGAPRVASVKLRADDPASTEGLDPANQSLADALRLVFRGLQVAMLVLLGVFAFSGVQKVNEAESGIKLLFGRPVASDLKPGPQFAAPYPFGELIKVRTGGEQLEVSDSFWPNLTEEQKKLPVEKAAAFNKPTLKPGEDGSNITADQNLAHTRWLVQYSRRDPRANIENVLQEHEPWIVRAAVERGVVHVLAGTKIDDLLKQSGSDQGSVARRAQLVAQETLDKVGAGIVIEQLTLKEKSPPFAVFTSFTGVQAAEQRAGERLNAAQSEARNTLNAMAGAAWEPLIAQIEAYERAIARGDEADQGRIMANIEAILDGRRQQGSDGNPQEPAAGRIAALMNEARQYRSTVVSQRRAELASFQAKLPQFKTNPELVVQRDWADAMAQLMRRDTVEVFWVPPGIERVELWLNRDVYKQRQMERERKRQELKERDARTLSDLEKEALKTRTDLQTMSTEIK
jgi:modulator of FtsH protease HflK